MLGLGVSSASQLGGTAFALENSILAAFKTRVLADSGVVEDYACLNLDVKDLITEPAPFTTGLLEFYPGAAAAYSLRQLRRSVSPYAIRVRRSGDSLEQDIGFNSNGELDTNALLAFAGSGDAWVDTWYDQSSYGNDAVQDTTEFQPQIVSSGSLITENGKPAIKLDGVTEHFVLTGFTNGVSNYGCFFVGLNESTGTFADYLFDTLDPTHGRFIIDARGTNNGVYYDGAFRGTGYTHTTQAVTSIHMVAPNSGSSYLNGTSTNTGLSYTQKAIGGPVVLGARYDGAAIHWDGKFQEFVLYASDQSSNRTGIEDNINNFYSIY